MKKINLILGIFTLAVLGLITALFLPNLPDVFGIGLTGVSLGFVALAGTDGQSILGGPNMTLGPCNVYYKTSLKPVLSGTISNTSAAITGTVAVAPILNTTKSRMTGTGTSFLTDLVKGQMISVNGNIAKVLSISSDTIAILDTSFTVVAGEDCLKALLTVTGSGTSFLTELAGVKAITLNGATFAEIDEITSDTVLTIKAPTLISSASAFRVFTAINLGGTDSTNLKLAIKKKGLTESQYGEGDADAVVTGGECSVEVGLSRFTLERGEATFQGLKTKKDANGAYTGFGVGVLLGETDSQIWDQLTLVRILGGVESSNPLDTIHIPKAAPKGEADWKYDAATQRYTKTMFMGYRSKDHVTEDGMELFAYAGNMVEE